MNIRKSDPGTQSPIDACKRLWMLSEMGQNTLLNALMGVCGIDYIDQDRFLNPQILMTAAEQIIRSRATEADEDAAAEMIKAMRGAENELKSWIREIQLYAPGHPELWKVCAFFLERLLRGEVDEPPHDSFSAGLERLKESLAPDKPIDYFWHEAWELQCRIIRHTGSTNN